jgi:hypothetical protein
MNLEESFAEDFALYKRGVIGTGINDNGTSRPVFFRDFFPERAAYFDKYAPEVRREQLAAIDDLEAARAPAFAPRVPAKAAKAVKSVPLTKAAPPAARKVTKAAPSAAPTTQRATTPNQDNALAKMGERGDWASASELGAHHATMGSLVRRGLASEQIGPDGKKQYRLAGEVTPEPTRPAVKRAPAKAAVPAKAAPVKAAKAAKAAKTTAPAKKTAAKATAPEAPVARKVKKTAPPVAEAPVEAAPAASKADLFGKAPDAVPGAKLPAKAARANVVTQTARKKRAKDVAALRGEPASGIPEGFPTPA